MLHLKRIHFYEARQSAYEAFCGIAAKYEAALRAMKRSLFRLHSAIFAKKMLLWDCRRLSEAQYKSYTILTPGLSSAALAKEEGRKLHKWSVSETSSQATKGSDFTSKASGIW